AGGPDKHFLPWLARELTERGHTVIAPPLPNAKTPNITEQIEFLKKEVTFDENTIVVAHSLGTVVSMKVLESLNAPVRKLVLVGGFSDTNIGSDKGYFETFDWTFDFEKISANAREIVVVHDDNDDVIPLEQALRLEQKLDATLVRRVAE